MKLGVNIDHIAVLREARKINEPSPLEAVFAAKNGGADQITIHLREDRRHINEDDLAQIAASSALRLNVECSINPQIIEIVLKNHPHQITLVPENRAEITTEGGLVVRNLEVQIKKIAALCKEEGIICSLFIEPKDAEFCAKLGIDSIELHTGRYANLCLMLSSNLPKTRNFVPEFANLSRNALKTELENEIKALQNAAQNAAALGLKVAAGHGLNYYNLEPILQISQIQELNIGQAIVTRAVFCGLENAVAQMKNTILNYLQK